MSRARRADGAEHDRGHRGPRAAAGVRPARSSTRSSTTSASTRRRPGCSSRAPLIETVAEFLEEHPVPLVVDPVMVASSGAKLLAGRRRRDARRAAVPARHGRDAEPARGAGADRRSTARPARARRAAGRARRPRRARHRRPRRDSRSTTSSTGSDARRDPGRALRRRARRTAPAARTRRRSRRCSRAGCSLEDAARGASRAASAAVEHGLAEIGAGDGPVDVLNVKGRR